MHPVSLCQVGGKPHKPRPAISHGVRQAHGANSTTTKGDDATLTGQSGGTVVDRALVQH